MKELKGKTVIITGGSRGIGRSCVEQFYEAGANVVFTYNKSRAQALGLQKLGKNISAIKADVKDYEQCRSVAVKALKIFGRIDILVNNAGKTCDRALFMMSSEDWQDVVDTNLGGTYNMTRALITTFMKQKNGCVINMSSVSGLTGLPRQTNYSASKAGIIGFTKALAKEVASYGIRVNAVCPGYINTDMINIMGEEAKKNVLNSIPAKRMGEPKEVAQLCVYLATDKAKYINGEAIKIDGGLAI